LDRRTERESVFLKFSANAFGEEEESPQLLPFIGTGIREDYATRDPRDTVANRRLTRVAKSFLVAKIMRRNPAASQKLTRGAVHLMNREIRAPKRKISPFPQASWRRNHDIA